MIQYNPLLDADAYKYSHYKQYPKNASGYFGYIEARTGATDGTLYFGEQAFRKAYLEKPFTLDDIYEAEDYMNTIGLEFNTAGARYILKKYGGHAPIIIRSVPEGSLVPVGNALLTVECEDPEAFWYASFLETKLLRGIWYPTTVATISFYIKKLIKENMLETCDNLGKLPFMLHDFGSRGVSSHESSMIGGASHLVNFLGTDTVSALPFIKKYYLSRTNIAATINASEHSTITSWGKENEEEAYRNMLQTYKHKGILACVSDSYDIYNACENIWGGSLRQEVIDSGAIVVIRPDSGNPVEVVSRLLNILNDKFGSVVNTKGYRVLNNVRLIQGDGVDPESIKTILAAMKENGYSADNIAFGMGGALLQKLNRDTYGFAMKCSAIKIDGVWNDVFKEPVTQKSKFSKRGRLRLLTDGNDFQTSSTEVPLPAGWKSAMNITYNMGEHSQSEEFEIIRGRSESFL